MSFICKPICLLICIVPALVNAGPDTLDTVITDTVEAIENSRQTQKTIEQLADSTSDMLLEYRNTLQQIDGLKIYNEQLEKLISSQKQTLVSISKQLDGVEETQRNIVPLLIRMIDVLEKFITLDMPFLTTERKTRLQTIKGMMDRPDVSLPDKYRRIMEAYLIEMDYGRNIETDSDTIAKDGKNLSVTLLRVGRVALLYQTLDGNESGYWDKHQRNWKRLPDSYNASIAEGILIADRQAPPGFFNIPVEVRQYTK